MFKIKISGIVQGVGFRPFIYNNALKLNLIGTVQNTSLGVTIICENKIKILKILENPPPLSKIDKIEIEEIKIKNKISNFTILPSENKKSYTQIPSDLNTCENCLNELFNSKNKRRYLHPFISCTNCGPRYSSIIKTPYDRKNTTFNKFEMCTECKKEYKNPKNRRYQAQTICCNNCGPKINLYFNKKKIICENPILEVSKLIKKGEIIAIKGIGGFALVCNISSVLKLKKITKRQYKPFALMSKNLNQIEKYCEISKKEKEKLISKERPIVLLEKIKTSQTSKISEDLKIPDSLKNKFKEISELSTLGFMIPSNPIQYLLLEKFNEPLIFTSSNLPNKPITTKKEEQFVNYVLDYNRKIENFVDDSIIKIIDETSQNFQFSNGLQIISKKNLLKPLIIRRSRGYALNEIEIPKNYRNSCNNILATGPELKNTFAIKKKSKIILSQHIGNIYNLENYKNYKNTIFKLIDFTQTKIDMILSDLNSNYNSSQFAKEFSNKNNIENLKIQHHIAHSFSIAFEHNLINFISVICDGTGLGNDNKVWGGEIFHNDIRIGHLENQTLIGGDSANKEPIKILVGILSKFMTKNKINKILTKLNLEELSIFIKQKEQNFNCIETSSCGRILDCISILLGFSNTNYYEGRCAMLLESNSSKKVKLFFEPIIEFNEKTKLYILKTTPIFEFITKNIKTIPKEDLARFSQIYLAKGLYEITQKYQKNKKINIPIFFGGGCAYNSIITSYMLKNKVLLNKEIPCGDGGLSIGQIAYYLWKKKINK